jgi:hypothetical protein
MKRVFYILLLFITVTNACSKDHSETATGVVKNYTGLDGCGMMIVLDSGGALEILSLPSNTTLIENRKVRIEYIAEPRNSICMAGITVHIKSLQYI